MTTDRAAILTRVGVVEFAPSLFLEVAVGFLTGREQPRDIWQRLYWQTGSTLDASEAWHAFTPAFSAWLESDEAREIFTDAERLSLHGRAQRDRQAARESLNKEREIARRNQIAWRQNVAKGDGATIDDFRHMVDRLRPTRGREQGAGPRRARRSSGSSSGDDSSGEPGPGDRPGHSDLDDLLGGQS